MNALGMFLLLASGPQEPAKNAAAEFFGLVPGMKRFYSATQEKTVTDSVDTVAEAIFGKDTVFSVNSQIGSVAEKNYYAIQDDGVYWVADWEGKKFDLPRPMLKCGDTEVKWSWQASDGGFALRLSYTTKPGKTQTVLGKELPTLVLHVEGDSGDDILATHLEQDAVFAKGVGMIEMTEKTSTKKSKSSRTVKLVKVTGGGW